MSGRTDTLTDTERLEWLVQTVSSVSQFLNGSSLWKMDFMSTIVPQSFGEMHADEFRAAIDAAMDVEKRG